MQGGGVHNSIGRGITSMQGCQPQKPVNDNVHGKQRRNRNLTEQQFFGELSLKHCESCTPKKK